MTRSKAFSLMIASLLVLALVAAGAPITGMSLPHLFAQSTFTQSSNPLFDLGPLRHRQAMASQKPKGISSPRGAFGSSALMGRITFMSDRDGDFEIYSMNADGSSQVALTANAAAESSPAWSPDGNKIVFHSWRDGNAEVYVMNADGSNQVNLTNNPAADFYASWSPDGSKIAFTSDRSGYVEIYTMNPDGSEQTRITYNYAYSAYPHWSPDGNKIVFMYSADGTWYCDTNWDIYVMDANGGNPMRLTHHSYADVYPTWFPGSKITFTSCRYGDDDIFVMNADGSNKTVLTYYSIYNDWASVWSPDGTRIAFSTDRDGDEEIYVMNADGSYQTNVTNSPLGDDRGPSWHTGPELTFSIFPIYPTSHATPSTVMQGGTVYRHFRLLDAEGSPISNASVAFSTGASAATDAQGYFTYTVSADSLGGPGTTYPISVQGIMIGGQTYGTGGQPAFNVEVTERRYSHAWSYGASTRAKGGISAGLVAYLQRTTSGGLELKLDESNPNLTGDDVVLMKEDFSDEIGAGGGVGIEKGVSILIVQLKGGASATSEWAIRSIGSTQARFPDPYSDNDRKGEGVFLLASVIDSIGQAFPGKPFAYNFLKLGLDRAAPYRNYISRQQAGLGNRATPLQANVGASVSMGLQRGGVTWKERLLGFDLVDVGVTVMQMNTLTDYRDRNEWALGYESEHDVDWSLLSWQIGDFKNKFAGTIGDRARKVKVELIFDGDTDALKRLELSFIGEGNPFAFTDVLKEEVTLKLLIPADQLGNDRLSRTVNVIRLLNAAQQEHSDPLQIGPSVMVNELNNLLDGLEYAEYEVTVDDGAETSYAVELGVTAIIKIELGPGLEVKKVRRLVRERGVFLNGRPYRTDSYAADSYVSHPGKSWWDLTKNALGGLWLLVRDAFSWAWQQVTSGMGWVIGTVSRTVDGIIRGGAQIIAPPGTHLYAVGFGPQTAAIQQTGSVTVTALGWVPMGTTGVSNLGLSPAVATASGADFVVGGIYEFQPYTLTVSPAATLVITYTEAAVAGVDENYIGMFRWDSYENNWKPVAAQADLATNTFTTSITQMGTFALGYDGTPPKISILAPADGSIIVTTLPLISALVVDEGVGIDPDTVQMRLEGRIVAADYITGTGQLLYQLEEPLENGVYTVAVSAADVVGNASSVSATFTVQIHRIHLPIIVLNR